MEIKIKHITYFYLLAFGIAWIFWIPMALYHYEIIDIKIPIIIGQSIGAFAPFIAVLIISRTLRDKSIFNLPFRQLKRSKQQIPLLVMASVFAVIIAICVSLVNRVTGETGSLTIIKSPVYNKLGNSVYMVIIIQFFTSLIGSPLGEEIGWRGFVLKNLKSKIGQIPAGIIVGSLWWLWHIPLFIVLNIPITLFSYLQMLGFSFFIDYLFLKSENNILVAMLAHQSITTKFTFFDGKTNEPEGLMVLWGILFLVLIFKTIRNKQNLFIPK